MPGNRQVFDTSVRHAQALVRQRAWSRAAIEYKRALAEFPDDHPTLLAAGTVFLQLNQSPDALAVLQHANEVKPGDMDTLGHLAETYARLGQTAQAVQTFTELGDLYARMEMAAQAAEAWASASALAPDDVELHKNLADAYEALEKPKQVVAELLALVRIFQSQGQVDEAAQHCKLALSIDPRNTDALKTLNQIRSEKDDRGLDAFAQATEAGTDSAPALPSPASRQTDWDNLDLGGSAESGQALGSPVDIAAQKALSDLAESLFEETPAPAIPAGLSKAEIDALVGQAIDFQTRGQPQQAIAAYRRILEATEMPAARFNLGLLYEQELMFEEAIEQFKISAQDPEYALGSLFASGECYRARGRIDEALEQFIQVLKIVDLATVKREQADDLITLYENLADTYVTKGDPERAVGFTNSLVEFLSSRGWEDKVISARNRLDSLTEDGAPAISLAELLTIPSAENVLQSLSLTQEFTRRGKIYTALEETYTAIIQAPDYLPLHRQLADILWECGQEDSAVAKYQMIANTYQVRGNIRQAMTVYQRILRLMPMDVQTRCKFIDLLVTHGEIDKALEQHMALADSYYQLAQIDKAREQYQEALKFAPRASDSRYWTQQILHKLGDIDMQRIDWRRAIQDYEQIKVLAPDDEKARLSLIELYFKVGGSARAIKELDDLLTTYTVAGKTRKVIGVLEDQVRSHSNEMGLRSRLARVYLQSGMMAQAIEQLDSLGDLQIQAGMLKEASATLRGIIGLNPPNVQEYRQALAQITSRASG